MYHGHTKGVVMADRTGGFWLIHSVPHYPSVTYSQYTYPATGHKNGQSYMCMSLPPDQMETVGNKTSCEFLWLACKVHIKRLLSSDGLFIKKDYIHQRVNCSYGFLWISFPTVGCNIPRTYILFLCIPIFYSYILHLIIVCIPSVQLFCPIISYLNMLF